MLLGDAVMLFHRKMRHYKKYRALTDTDPLVKYMRQTYKTSITDYYQNTDHTLRNEGTTANKGFLSCTVKK